MVEQDKSIETINQAAWDKLKAANRISFKTRP